MTQALSITYADIKSYLEGMTSGHVSPGGLSNQANRYQYAPHKELTEPEMDAIFKHFGYSPSQIKSYNSGNFGQAGWLASALQGVAGGLAADPVTAPLTDIGGLLGIGGDGADVAADGTAVAADGTGGAAGAVGSNALKTVTAVGTAGVLADAYNGLLHKAKYAGVWVVLMVLGVVLIMKGLDAKPPVPKFVPVPA